MPGVVMDTEPAVISLISDLPSRGDNDLSEAGTVGASKSPSLSPGFVASVHTLVIVVVTADSVK